MPVNKTKTMEEIEKESDMHPEWEFDPILDIIKEADEKLKLIKTVPSKKEKSKVKKGKSKSKASKSKKVKNTKVKEDIESTEDTKIVSEGDDKDSGLKDSADKTEEEESEEIKLMEDTDPSADNEPTKKKKKKVIKGKKNKTKKTKKPKLKLNKVSRRIAMALKLNDENTEPDDKMLQVKIPSNCYVDLNNIIKIERP